MRSRQQQSTIQSSDAANPESDDAHGHGHRSRRKELNEEPFCLVALLKAGESLDRVTNLLPPARREIVLQLATRVFKFAEHELRKKLAAVGRRLFFK